jgi:hypothetical protein
MRELFRVILLFVVFGFDHVVVYASSFQSIYSFASLKVVDANRQISAFEGSFQKMYAPTGLTGCALGVSQFSSLCAYPGSGVLSFGFPGYTYPTNINEVKIYVPPGAFRFSLYGFLPQSVTAAVALRMDQAPERVAALSDDEYRTTKSQMDNDTTFQQLLAGKELIRVHDGGGTFKPVWGYANNTSILEKTTTGRWLYIRFINQADIDGFTSAISVDLPLYQAWYSASTTKWDANGDPIDTNSGSSGGTTTPTAQLLTNISLSPDTSLIKGNLPTQITITPIPATASLGICEVNRSDLVTIAGNAISFKPSVNNIVTNTDVDIICGSVKKKITVHANTIPLTSFNLSTYSLVNNKTDETVVITPVPNDASVAGSSCTVTDDSLLGVTSSPYLTPFTETPPSFRLTDAAKALKSDRLLKIVCGGFSRDFTITMPLAIKEFRPPDNLSNQPLFSLGFTFKPSDLISSDIADVYVIGYIPKIINSVYGVIDDAMICRTSDDKNWVYMPGRFLPNICKKTIGFNSNVTISLGGDPSSIPVGEILRDYFFGFPESAFKENEVELYVAYKKSSDINFKFIDGSGGGTYAKNGIKALWLFKK